MRTEIQFLIDLLLNHKLPEAVRTLCVARIGDVESQLNYKQASNPQPIVSSSSRPPKTAQSPSTQKILDEMEAEKNALEGAPPPMEAIIASPEAATAMMLRKQAIKSAVSSDPFSSKPEPGRTSPRKF